MQQNEEPWKHAHRERSREKGCKGLQPPAPGHRVCTSKTDNYQLQKQRSLRKSSGQRAGWAADSSWGLCCQPGNGAPGLHWKPLGGSRAANHCPTVFWVCQGESPSLPSPPCCQRLFRSLGSTPAHHVARGTGSSQHSHPESLGVTRRGSPSPTANILAFSLPRSSRDRKEVSSAQTASHTPLSLTWGDQELRNRLQCIITSPLLGSRANI